MMCAADGVDVLTIICTLTEPADSEVRAMQQSNELQSVAGLTGEPRHISAAGVTRTGQRLITLENTSPFDPSHDRPAAHRRGRRQRPGGSGHAGGDSLVQNGCAPQRSRPVGSQRRPAFVRERCDARPAAGISAGERVFRSPRTAGEPVSMAMGGVSGARSSCCRSAAETSFHAARRPRARWRQRWREDRKSAPCPLSYGLARETDGPALLQHALNDAAGTPMSEIRSTLRARASREPLAIARVLAGKYPQTPTRQLHSVGGVGQYASACGHHER